MGGGHKNREFYCTFLLGINDGHHYFIPLSINYPLLDPMNYHNFEGPLTISPRDKCSNQRKSRICENID